MRIQTLYINKYKNLNDFKVEFNCDKSTIVFLGRNGAAKSNLIEALVLIFKALDLNEVTPFTYKIKYICKEKEITINATSPKIRVYVDGEEKNVSYLNRDSKNRLLPKNVFGYYSGINKRLESLFDQHQEAFYRDLMDNKELPLRPLFYARTVHSQYVLLSFFSFENDVPSEFLKKYLGITGFINAEFILKQPDWYDPQRSKDDYFWGAKGVVRGFLDDLKSIAYGPIKRKERIPFPPYGKYKSEERIHLRIEDLQSLRKLASKYGHNVDFFKTLESTYIADLIAQLVIRVKKEGIDNDVEFTELSEGEQQLLTVLGLLRFTKEEESLFLLDEPDTHLNPTWKYEYIDLLKDVVGDNPTSQIFMVTHDPLVIAGLLKDQVLLFSIADKDKRALARQPETDPRGMGFTGLLTSELFGLSSSVDRETQDKLDRKRQLVVKSKLDNSEERELNTLDTDLEKLGFMTAFRDPLYSIFLKAVQEYELFNKKEMTPDDRKKQSQLALEIVKKIKEGSSS